MGSCFLTLVGPFDCLSTFDASGVDMKQITQVWPWLLMQADSCDILFAEVRAASEFPGCSPFPDRLASVS